MNEACAEEGKEVSNDRDILIESYQTPPVVSKKPCDESGGVSASDPGFSSIDNRQSLNEKSANNDESEAAGASAAQLIQEKENAAPQVKKDEAAEAAMATAAQ